MPPVRPEQIPVPSLVLTALVAPDGHRSLPPQRRGLPGLGLELCGGGVVVLAGLGGLLEAEVLLYDGAPADGVLEEGATAHAREGAQGEVGAAVLGQGGGHAV